MPVKKHTDETRKRISETRKKQEAAKRLALATTNKQPNSVVQITQRTSQLDSFRSITLPRIRSILQSTTNGKLKEWADFCATMVADDPHLEGLVSTRKLAVAGSDLWVEPADESDEAKASADFVRTIIDNIPGFRRNIYALLDAIFTGAGIAEIHWTPQQQDFHISAIEACPLRLFAFDSSLILIIDDLENTEHNGKPLSDFGSKFIVHTPGVLNPHFPTQDGLFRPCAYYWAMKKIGIGYWLGGAERFAFPLPIGFVPPNTPKEITEAFRNSLSQMSSETAIVLEEGTRIDTLSQGAVSGGDAVWNNLLKYFDSQLTKLITGGTLTVDAGAKGSYALGEVHERTRHDLSVSDGEALAETLRRDLVIPILEMNLHRFGGKMPPVPRLWFDIKEYKPIEQWHVQTGLIKKNQILESLGLPRLPTNMGGEQIATFEALETNQPQESAPNESAPKDSPEVAEGVDVQKTALNGAQVQSLQAIIQAVASGMMPGNSAIELIVNAFPAIDRATAESMVRPAESFTPANPEGGLSSDPFLARAPRRNVAATNPKNSQTFSLWTKTLNKKSPRGSES